MPKTMITVHMLALVFLSLGAVPVVQANSGAPASSGVPDPCKMLSKAEVESVLGNGHDITASTDNPARKTCTYKTSGPKDAKEVFTVTTTFNNDYPCGGKSCMSAWNMLKMVAGKGIPVPGLGDEAYFSQLGGNGIKVLIGQLIVEIDMPVYLNSDPDAAKNHHDQELALARKIVAKVR